VQFDRTGHVRQKPGTVRCRWRSESGYVSWRSILSAGSTCAPKGSKAAGGVTRSVREELELACTGELNGRALTAVEIMGTDTIVRWFANVFARTSTSSHRVEENERVVCYAERKIGRAPQTIDIERDLAPNAGGTRFIRVEPAVDLRPDEAVTSSAIRHLMSNGQWECLRVSGWLHPAVLDGLQHESGFSSV
jgi:hypothetical protein